MEQMQHTKPCKLLYKPQVPSCRHYFYGLIFIKISADVYIQDCYLRCIGVQAASSGVQQKWNATTVGCLPCAIRHCIPGPTVSTPTLALQQAAHAAEALNTHTHVTNLHPSLHCCTVNLVHNAAKLLYQQLCFIYIYLYKFCNTAEHCTTVLLGCHQAWCTHVLHVSLLACVMRTELPFRCSVVDGHARLLAAGASMRNDQTRPKFGLVPVRLCQ